MSYKRDYPVPVNEIAEKLRGSCDSLHDVLYRNDMEDAEDDLEWCHDLDDRVFCCERCGWWEEISEAVDTQGNTLTCYECVTE